MQNLFVDTVTTTAVCTCLYLYFYAAQVPVPGTAAVFEGLVLPTNSIMITPAVKVPYKSCKCILYDTAASCRGPWSSVICTAT